MYNPNNLPAFIDIGYTGENLFREIQFDMSPWGEGTPGIVYLRPDGEEYRPTVSYTNHIMTWTIQRDDLKEGEGKIQLEMVSEDRRRKSPVISVRVHHGIMR